MDDYDFANFANMALISATVIEFIKLKQNEEYFNFMKKKKIIMFN